MTERDIFRLVLNIKQDGMALIEGCAARVLAAKANRDSLFDEAGEGKSFGHAVVERLLAGAHFLPLLK